MCCLGQQIHGFSRFEFLNSFKTVNGHVNGKILSIVSRLMGPQEGLSITTLSVEQVIVQVTHVIILSTTSLLGVELNRDPDSQENSEIPFLGASEFLDFNSVSINP